MKNSRSLEIGTGLFVLLGFAALAFLTTQLPGSKLAVMGDSGGYAVTARFDNVGDIQAGAPVAMGGVKIGRVARVVYDSTDYKAVVSMVIDSQYDRIPDDSWAGIETAGLLGANPHATGLTRWWALTSFTDHFHAPTPDRREVGGSTPPGPPMSN